MPRKVRDHAILSDAPTVGLAPKHLSKSEFAKRLYKLMTSKGWRQSELARQAGLNRDAVSTYIRGRTFPTKRSLEALAAALGVNPDELFPNILESAIDEDNPAFEMKVSPNAPSSAWVRVNRLVSTATAVKIAELLQADDALNRGRSGAAAPL